MTEQENNQELRVFEFPDYYHDKWGIKRSAYIASRSVNSAAKELGVSRYKFSKHGKELSGSSTLLDFVIGNPHTTLVDIDGHLLDVKEVDPEFDIPKLELKPDAKKSPPKKKAEDKGSMRVDVKDCARCRKNHNDLYFSSFKNPILETKDDEPRWTHWGMCPTYQEPILLRVIVVSE